MDPEIENEVQRILAQENNVAIIENEGYVFLILYWVDEKNEISNFLTKIVFSVKNYVNEK